MQKMLNSSSSEEYNIQYLIKGYVYNYSESSNLFSYKLGNAGIALTHLTSVVSTLIGGAEDFVVASIKKITGINHFLFSGALYTGINSMMCTWLISDR